MPFALSLLAHDSRRARVHPRVEQYDEQDTSDEEDSSGTVTGSEVISSFTSRTRPASSPRSSFMATPSQQDYLMPAPTNAPGCSSRSSPRSSAASTPSHSRPSSPFLSPLYNSDADSEPGSPLLGGPLSSSSRSWWNDDRDNSRRWWDQPRRRYRHRSSLYRSARKTLHKFMLHPLVPTRPTTILLFFLLLSIFAVLLGLLLKYILDPDKAPLPWRAYCAFPPTSTLPPSLAGAYNPTLNDSTLIVPPFPPARLDALPPVGIFLAVFSMDSALERRMLVRSTWATHNRSRNGAGVGDGGFATSRTIVRFVLGQPRKDWERRIKLEMETYNDIIILPMAENMNGGKTHAYFAWAAEHAWVPGPDPQASPSYMTPTFSYSDQTHPAPRLAHHDPLIIRKEHETGIDRLWVRPDFVIKSDDDAFVMLAELEAHLRLALYPEDTKMNGDSPPHDSDQPLLRDTYHGTNTSLSPTATLGSRTLPSPLDDPLVYWGYLVKNQFMAGELYALSWSLVDWASTDAIVKTLVRGKEDKQTAKWMRAHPRWTQIRWVSEKCWVYDHPRAGTVYSHGFLFPSEVTRIKKSLLSYLSDTPTPKSSIDGARLHAIVPPTTAALTSNSRHTSSWWSYSSVSTFRSRYAPPVEGLAVAESVEALVEGSEMSHLKEVGPMTPDYAWVHREGRAKQYEGRRLGGTVLVHFIKKNAWFLETALALLEGVEVTELDALDKQGQSAESQGLTRP